MASKIPVHQEKRQPEITNPKATGRIAENMKRTNVKCEFKETTVPSNFNFASKTDSAGILKPQNNVPRKKLTATAYKKPLARLETELRDQKSLLEAFNRDLQQNLSQSKEKIDLLEQQCIDIQGEKNEIQKQLENCLHLLVAGNIDLDSGETAQQKKEQRKEVQNVSQELMGELQTFGQKVSEHRAQVQVQERMRDLREERERHLEEREAFSLEVEEMEKALEQAEELLVEI